MPLSSSPESHSELRAAQQLSAASEAPVDAATALAHAVLDELNVEGCIVALFEGEQLLVKGAAGILADFRGDVASLGGSLAASAVEARRVLTGPSGDPPGVRATLAAPLEAGGGAFGAILAVSPRTGSFSDADQATAGRLASLGSLAVRNAKLLERERRTARHAATLSRSARSLAASIEPNTLFDAMAEVARSLLDVDYVAVYASSFVGLERPELLYTSEADAEPSARITAEPWWPGVHEAHFAGDARTVRHQAWAGIPHDPRVRAAAQLPLVVDGKLNGVLVVSWRATREFHDDERTLLHDFALQLALALRNAGLVRDLERRAHRFSAVARMQQAIARPQLRDIYLEVQRAVSTSVPRAATVALLLRSEDGQHLSPQLVVVRGLTTRGGALDPVPITTCIASRALGFASPVLGSNPQRTWAHVVPGCFNRPAAESEAAAPLIHGDGERAMGVLLVQAEESNAFTHEDVDVIALIARQAASAILIARQLEAETHLREVSEAAAAIAKAAVEADTPATLCAQVLQVLERILPASGRALGLVRADSDIIRYKAAAGSLSALQGNSAPLRAPVLEPGSVWVAPTTVPLLNDSFATSAQLLFTPLCANARVLGVLVSDIPHGGRAPRDQETLDRLANTIAVAADVVLLKAEEKRRRQREQTLATALATMDQAVFVVGLNGHAEYANVAAEREYGYTSDALRSRPLRELIDVAIPLRSVGDVTTRIAEQQHRRADGSRFPASVMFSILRDETGSESGVVIACRNLTEEHRIEEQLRQSEKLVALGELVAGVAHELNNPLAGISAFAQLLMEDELSTDQSESVRLIKQEADRAVGVIRDLLVFSRKSGPTQAPLDLNEMIALTLRLRGYSLRTAGVEVRTDLELSLPLVMGDDKRLQQVFLNLVVNAEHALHGRSRRELYIATRHEQDGVVVTVADTGVGMSDEVRQRIFEPFFTTKPPGEGTGLGLSVSYGIVRAHGGTISVTSAEGDGATFTLRLPAARDDAEILHTA